MPKALQHDRDLDGLRKAYGIVDGDWAEALRIRMGLRASVLVDDVRSLIAPPRQIVAGYQLDQAAVIGNYSGVRITINSPGGAWVTLTCAGNTPRFTTENPIAFTFSAFLNPEILQPAGSTPTTVVERGFSAAVPAGMGVGQLFMSTVFPIYFAQGTLIQVWEASGQNTLLSAALKVAEIP